MKKLPATDNRNTMINRIEAIVGDTFPGSKYEINANPMVISIIIKTTFSMDAPIIKRAVFIFLFMLFYVLKNKRNK
jgi:hypothetical protein